MREAVKGGALCSKGGSEMKPVWRYAGAAALGILAIALFARPATALSVGDKAPAVNAPSTLAGRTMDFHLSGALSKHAIILYFFPKAFTQG